MVTDAGVVPGVKICGGSGPDVFVVKLNVGVFPSVAIDAPANGQEFADELEKRKNLVLTSTGGVAGGDLPASVLQLFQEYLGMIPSVLVRDSWILRLI